MGQLDAAFAAYLSDIAELENGLRQCAVGASRAIVSGPNVSSSHVKEPATGPIAAIATGGELGQSLAVKSGRSPESAALGGTEQRGSGKSWIEIEIDDAPVASDGVN